MTFQAQEELSLPKSFVSNNSNPNSPRSQPDDGIRLSMPYTPPASTSSRNTPVQTHDDAHEEGLVEGFRAMNITQTHYLGRSSGLVFIRTAIALKEEYSELGPQNAHPSQTNRRIEYDDPRFKLRRPAFWEAGLVSVPYCPTLSALSDNFTAAASTASPPSPRSVSSAELIGGAYRQLFPPLQRVLSFAASSNSRMRFTEWLTSDRRRLRLRSFACLRDGSKILVQPTRSAGEYYTLAMGRLAVVRARQLSPAACPSRFT
jgi:hypothetical protein